MTTSAEYNQYTAYLEQGENVDLAVFMTWLDKQDGEWIKKKSGIHLTPLHHAMKAAAWRGTPDDAVVLAVLAAWPDAVKCTDIDPVYDVENAPLINAALDYLLLPIPKQWCWRCFLRGPAPLRPCRRPTMLQSS